MPGGGWCPPGFLQAPGAHGQVGVGRGHPESEAAGPGTSLSRAESMG